MAVDYKKELERAAKSMILVHKPDILIKMVARMLVQKVKITHAGVLLHDKARDSYILDVSRGPSGIKIPAGFARIDSDNPLIRFLKEHKEEKIFSDGAIVRKEVEGLLKKKIKPAIKKLLKQVLFQMDIFEAIICIPNYFRDELVGIVLLGKKRNGKEFKREEIDFFIALAYDVAMAIRNAQLFNELASELDKRKKLFLHTTVALAAAIDAKDHYTHGHTSRVTSLSLEIAKKLCQQNKISLSDKFLERLHIASLLHDIGKIGIPESILNKDGPLNEEEKKVVREHPVIGANILQPIKELEDAILGVKYHHEKSDGSGYPEGLKGNQIPLIASIISVADTFDAMITDRPYRRGLSKEEAAKEIERVSGKQFDAQVAGALIELYQEGKA